MAKNIPSRPQNFYQPLAARLHGPEFNDREGLIADVRANAFQSIDLSQSAAQRLFNFFSALESSVDVGILLSPGQTRHVARLATDHARSLLGGKARLQRAVYEAATYIASCRPQVDAVLAKELPETATPLNVLAHHNNPRLESDKQRIFFEELRRLTRLDVCLTEAQFNGVRHKAEKDHTSFLGGKGRRLHVLTETAVQVNNTRMACANCLNSDCSMRDPEVPGPVVNL